MAREKKPVGWAYSYFQCGTSDKTFNISVIQLPLLYFGGIGGSDCSALSLTIWSFCYNQISSLLVENSK